MAHVPNCEGQILAFEFLNKRKGGITGQVNSVSKDGKVNSWGREWGDMVIKRQGQSKQSFVPLTKLFIIT